MRAPPVATQLSFAEFASDPREPSLFDIRPAGQLKDIIMNNVTPIRPTPVAAIEAALIRGDLSALTEEERLQYYNRVCESVGLNPMTQPFEYITLNGKLRLYARKDATDQLRTIHKVSVVDLVESDWEGVFMVTAKVQNAEGRTDAAKGAVTITGLKGEALANALMKCETKAKRRATLSICGLGFLDEVEIDDMKENNNPAVTKEPMKTLPKKDAKAIYAKLQAEIDAPASRQDLTAWGEANAERISMMPDDWQDILRMRYRERMLDLQRSEPVGSSEAQPDADGVIWEETHERPATAEDKADLSRTIVLDEIKALIVLRVEPTNERRKLDLLSTHFKTTSWTEVVNVLPIDKLKDGYDSMHFTLEGRHSKYHQERMARAIDHTDINGTPAFLRRDAKPYSQSEILAAMAAE